MFLQQRIVFHTVLQSGLMDQHFHVLGIVEEILVWHRISREDDVAVFFAYKKTCVRLGAVVCFHRNHLLKGHLLRKHFIQLLDGIIFRLVLVYLFHYRLTFLRLADLCMWPVILGIN